MNTVKAYITILLLIVALVLKAQQPAISVDSLLKYHAQHVPALNESVSISVSSSTIQEFMRGIANSSGLNLDVDPALDFRVANNFSNVQVKDILVFLAKQYNLNITVIGNIVSVSGNETPEESNIDISYNQADNTVSIRVVKEDINLVVSEITRASNRNVITRPAARGTEINCFLQNVALESAIEKMALSNGLTMEKSDDGFLILDKAKEAPVQSTTQPANTRTTRQPRQRQPGRSPGETGEDGDFELEISKLAGDTLKLVVENAPVEELFSKLSNEFGFSYFISPDLEQKVTGRVTAANADEVIKYFLNGTEVSYKKLNNVFIVGSKEEFDFNEHKVVQLQNRSIDQILDVIPEEITGNLKVSEIVDLNSLFVSGPAHQIEQFEKFIQEIDKVVPVVLIEVIILSVDKSNSISTGINAGLGESPVETGGSVYPSIDFTIGANELNKVLNGIGTVNLGNVTPNFYLSLQLMEEQGFLEIQSTPKLSTLNGSEATLSIGNTEYYLEESSQLYGSQIPQQTTTRTYKSVNAELAITIKPFVSGDEFITLEIDVTQSDFTDKISKTAPPGTVNRKFNSKIRVKNQEMVLLGGLMESRSSNSGTGLPILSRIPIIKWLFSSRKKETSKAKLSVLIRPTIIN